jgi:hypothetical protein
MWLGHISEPTYSTKNGRFSVDFAGFSLLLVTISSHLASGTIDQILLTFAVYI